MQPDIIVIGAVGTALNICNQLVDARDRYKQPIGNVKVVIDNTMSGEIFNGFRVAGNTSDIQELLRENKNMFIFCLFRQDLMQERYSLLKDLDIPEFRYYSFRHPLSYISSDAKIGRGNVILSNANIHSNVVIGSNNIINSGVTIEHDTSIGNANFFSSGTIIGSGVSIGDTCFFGLQTSIREKVSIGDNVFCGMNSMILSNFNNCRVKGQPAKPY